MRLADGRLVLACLLFAGTSFAHGVHEFIEAGLLPPIIHEVWNTNAFLHEKQSVLGSLAKALFGYNGNPDLLEVLAYGAYWVVMGGLMIARRRAAQPAVTEGAEAVSSA